MSAWDGRPSVHGVSSHVGGPPAEPLATGTARGTAVALAGLALEALTGRPHRLLWCVDLERDAGVRTHRAAEEGPWVALLGRFKGALDRLPWGPAHCPLALASRQLVQDPDGCEACRYDVRAREEGQPCPVCARRVLLTFAVPYVVDATALCRGDPPVGCWRLWPVPQRDDLRPRGDTLPESFWTDSIPFAFLVAWAWAWEVAHGAVALGPWV